jgi:hypothetical protein
MTTTLENPLVFLLFGKHIGISFPGSHVLKRDYFSALPARLVPSVFLPSSVARDGRMKIVFVIAASSVAYSMYHVTWDLTLRAAGTIEEEEGVKKNTTPSLERIFEDA